MNGIKIIKRKNREELNQAKENNFGAETLCSRKNQHYVADRVKYWVKDFKAKKQNEEVVARRFFMENRLTANQV